MQNDNELLVIEAKVRYRWTADMEKTKTYLRPTIKNGLHQKSLVPYAALSNLIVGIDLYENI
jgi:hypothetical protein